MRGLRLAGYFWPGFIELWERGRWSALALAIVAAGVLNTTLVVSLGWDELIAPTARAVAWVGLAVIWALAAVVSGRRARIGSPMADNLAADLFPAALDEYLRGHWLEAEAICEQLLDRDPADVETRLLTATVYRRTGRVPEARQQLERLGTWACSDRWRAEIAHERDLLDETEAPAESETRQTPGETARRAA